MSKFKYDLGIIGLGYVGLPLAVYSIDAGLKVFGYDINSEKVLKLNQGVSPIEDVSDKTLNSSIDSGLIFSDESKSLRDCEHIVISVPTPLTDFKPDLSYVISAAQEIARNVVKGQVIILESTTYPGTTLEVLIPEIQKISDLTPGEDIYFGYSPERIDPGNKEWNFKNTPKVVSGINDDSLSKIKSFYEKIIDTVVVVSGTKEAEMVKLLENTYRATNIGLVNEIAIMCDHLNIDVWEVINAAATKPFGFTPFYPGPGLGGHCIPVDPQFLAWKLKTLNYNARFIQLATEVNTSMPDYVVTKITDILNQSSRALKGSKILILGIAYKPDVSDFRESPSLDVIDILRNKGALVSYNDPYIPDLKYEHFDMSSITLDESTMSRFDCVVITTNHSNYDWNWVVRHSKCILDTRNATANVTENKSSVVKL